MSKEWKLFNGYGRFNENCTEYEILNHNTPVPWSNILANENFGTIVSTHGTVYSFYKNASEYKITNWCNNWSDFRPGERFKGIYDNTYNLKYGFGYVKISSNENELDKKMDIFIPLKDDLKIQYITIKNQTKKEKKLLISYEIDVTLGVAQEKTDKYIISKQDQDIMLLKNSYSEHFSHIISYFKAISYVGNNKIEYASKDDKYNVQVEMKIKAGETNRLAIVLGATDEGEAKIKQLVEKYTIEENLKDEYKKTISYWKSKVVRNFKTGDENLDILANGWLLYQTIACRLFARTSLYQAGGAYGFRDQLQDSLALIKSWPEFTKKQIVKHSTKQFEQGDVLHWWHEHNNAGIRTYFSDDYLWLPYVVSEYVEKTNDLNILKIEKEYLENRPIRNGERELYDTFGVSGTVGTIYEHCLRAIKYGLSRKGMHGLLSIGDGDWNDGFSNIKGESVWLTFFMIDILDRFSRLAAVMNDEVNEMHFKSERHVLKHAITNSAYEGKYFTRAFYPNGNPIGSESSEDCKIDLISQAWAAISLKDYADYISEIKSGLKSAEEMLVDRENNIVKLLYPPFDNPKQNPGYIKAYIPGVRENGGQYTHAAIWFAKAYFDLKMKAKGLDILNILNPINHSDTKAKADIYMVEPFVLAADVYANEEHMGRGGWTWYTGSSAWMYKVIEDNFKEEELKTVKTKEDKASTKTKK